MPQLFHSLEITRNIDQYLIKRIADKSKFQFFITFKCWSIVCKAITFTTLQAQESYSLIKTWRRLCQKWF